MTVKRDEAEGKSERFEVWERFNPPFAGFEDERPQAWEDEQSLEAETNPWPTAGKETGTLVLQPQGHDFSPSTSREERSPADTLISAL